VIASDQLSRLKGRQVRISFNDGVVIRGRLITVDPDRLAEQVVYEVQAVEDAARGVRPELRAGGVYASDTGEIAKVEEL
jgi:hypothetical protein